ncbi:MAG: Mth938-like domain-containing protein [Nitrosomonadales bacterium]|nr:Mth938-like domain-containing protein [Nitrosomonadales bacterium]
MAIAQHGDPPVKLHLAQLGDTKLFTAHGPDHVMINGERHERSVVVLADAVREDWSVAGFDDLTEAHFAYFLEFKPDVVLLGTGTRQRFPHPRLYRALTDAGIGVEFMDTHAACRTYNILVAEGRKVIAAILL